MANFISQSHMYIEIEFIGMKGTLVIQIRCDVSCNT